MPGRTTLFLYGTLKHGQPAHRLIADQRYLGPAATAPAYRLYDLGPYPGLVPDEANGLAVQGELWEVSGCCLAELEDYEGVPELYRREPITIPTHGGPVETFVYNRPIPPAARSGAVWPLPTT